MLDRYDVLFIADEVITGFGRLGTPFGSQRLGMRPDTLSFAKALTSAYMPLGGVMIPEPMYQAMLDESRKIGTFGHGFTYSGHPVAAAVAVKTLEIYERDRIFEGVRRKAPPLPAPASRRFADHPLVGEARGHRADRRARDRGRQAHARRSSTRTRASPPSAPASRRARA